MRHRGRVFGLAAALLASAGSDALACGDKFLVSGRGTRYQRPRNARAASVLIYADPASALPGKVGKLPLESVLKREGHRSTRVESVEQLAAIVAGGHFDVVLAAANALEAVRRYVGAGPDAPVVVAFCARDRGAGEARSCVKTPPGEGALLQAIDRAVEQRDRSVRTARNRG